MKFFENQSINIFGYSLSITVIIATLILIISGCLVNIILNKLINKRINKSKNRHRKNLLYSVKYVKTYLIFIIVCVLVLQSFGVSLTWLIASSAALVVAFGLGLQQLVSNYMSGATLIFSEWFSIGDVIKIDNKSGKITKIGLRNTHLITPLGENIIIPNSRFLNDIVSNWSQSSVPKLFEINVGVSYGTDLDKTTKLISNSIKSISNINKNYEPVVLLDNFGDSSIDLVVRFSLVDTFKEVTSKSDVRFMIEKTLRENSIQIPFPQRDIHITNK